MVVVHIAFNYGMKPGQIVTKLAIQWWFSLVLVIPAQAGIHLCISTTLCIWTPAFAGATN